MASSRQGLVDLVESQCMPWVIGVWVFEYLHKPSAFLSLKFEHNYKKSVVIANLFVNSSMGFRKEGFCGFFYGS